MTKPEHIERLRALDWKKLSVRLTRYAHACLQKHWRHAEDLAQDAIADAFDPELPGWDPAVDPDVFDFLARSVRVLSANYRRAHAQTKRRRISEEKMEKLGPIASSEEMTLLNDQRAYLIVEWVRASFGTKDPRARKVLDLTEAQILTMAEQAEHMGCTMDEVRSARRRLTTQIKKAVAEIDAIRGEVAEKKEKLDA